MVEPKDIHPAIREALATHEALRRLGFAPENIFIMHDKKLTVVLKHGLHEVGVEIDHPISEKRFRDLWPTAVMLYNRAFTTDQIDAIWKESKIRAQLGIVVSALEERGISTPEMRLTLN